MKKFFGKTSRGTEIYAHTISDGDISITVLDYGATLQKFEHKGTDIICGFDSLETYISDKSHQGAVIGRYANRIGGGKLTIDGVDYPIARNDGEAHLHGGNINFERHTWNVEEGVCHDGAPAPQLRLCFRRRRRGVSRQTDRDGDLHTQKQFADRGLQSHDG